MSFESFFWNYWNFQFVFWIFRNIIFGMFGNVRAINARVPTRIKNASPLECAGMGPGRGRKGRGGYGGGGRGVRYRF